MMRRDRVLAWSGSIALLVAGVLGVFFGLLAAVTLACLVLLVARAVATLMLPVLLRDRLDALVVASLVGFGALIVQRALVILGR